MFSILKGVFDVVDGLSSIVYIDKTQYLDKINNNIENLDEKELINLFRDTFSTKIYNFVKNDDNETSIIGMIMVLASYKKLFNIELREKFFYFNDINESCENRDMIWEIKTYIQSKMYIDSFAINLLDQINSKILANLNYVINSNVTFIKSNTTESEKDKKHKSKMIFYLNCMFKLLSNIYDFKNNYYYSYFQYEWRNMYLKLFNMFIDFNNLPEVKLGEPEMKIDLQNFLTLFAQCMTKDTDYSLRKELLSSNPEFLYKIVIISTYLSGTCCCNHCFFPRTYACQKSIDSIYKLISFISDSNHYLFCNVKNLKIKIADFLAKKAGKNVCLVYLNKLMEICQNNDIVSYLLSETNLFMEMMKKEKQIQHIIDSLEKFISLIKDPKLILAFLNKFTTSQLIEYKRETREMIKKLVSNSSDFSTIKSVYEGNIFKNVLDLTSYTTTYSSLTEAEGIFESIVVTDNYNVIDIFYKNKFSIKNNFLKLINYYLDNNLHGLNIDAAFRIMTMFIVLGEKIKQKYYCQNFYIQELREIYYKITSFNTEDAQQFKKYFN